MKSNAFIEGALSALYKVSKHKECDLDFFEKIAREYGFEDAEELAYHDDKYNRFHDMIHALLEEKSAAEEE
jgi:hypothetical protein